MATEGKGPIVIPCYLVDGVPYVLEVDAAGKLAVRAAEIETLLGAGLPAALDSLALKVKEQSPISGFATSAKQDTMITALQLIDDLRAALLLVGTDRLGVRATELETLLGAGLPVALDSLALKVKEQSPLSGFATSANQATEITALQLIDDLRNALLTVATDRLGVRATEIETLLGAGLPIALDSLALKVKEQSPISGFATSANQTTMITALQLIDDLRNALLTVASDRLGVRATELETLLGGGLPAALDSLALKVKEQSPISGFATSAKQDTMITALQLIDDLRAALGSVNTDDLQVDVKTMPTVTVQAAGGDKLFAFESIVEEDIHDFNLPAGESNLAGTPVPAGKVWVLTAFSIVYAGTVPTTISVIAAGLAGDLRVFDQPSPTPGRYYTWVGQFILQVGDYMAARVEGASLGSAIILRYAGYQMDAP